MADPIRFIHTADLHLDAPFGGVDASDERVRLALVEATFNAFDRVVGSALERRVDFVVIAGDVYNAKNKSLRAQLRFQTQMKRLAEADISVFVAHGNHDPGDGWSARLEFPESVHIFATERVERLPVVRGEREVCAVYGRSYGTAAETSNLAAGFHRDPSDPVAIGVLHANVGGDPDHEPYAPCSVEDLRASNMDYWALGHIHAHRTLSDTPRASYSGNTQGLNPNETGPRGCYLVEIAASGTITQEFIETSEVLWAAASLDASECETIEDVRDLIAQACDRLREESDRPLIARLDIVGRCEAHDAIARTGVFDDLVQDSREQQLAGAPWVWLGRVRDLTRPTIDVERVRAGDDFAAALVAVADVVESDASAATELLRDALAPLERVTGSLALDIDALELVRRARDVCLDRLTFEERT